MPLTTTHSNKGLPTSLIWEVGAILMGFWCVFYYIDYPILDQLFELCSFMKTVISHENHVDGFFLNLYPSSILISLILFWWHSVLFWYPHLLCIQVKEPTKYPKSTDQISGGIWSVNETGFTGFEVDWCKHFLAITRLIYDGS